LVLSKPLGFGTITTAIKNREAQQEEIDEAVTWMKQLNRGAARLAKDFGLRGATDITGFSLLGHGWEMASNSQVGLRIEWEKIPFVTGAHRLAKAYSFPGGTLDNQSYFSEHVVFSRGLKEEERLLLFDAQTSGGLLLAVPPDKITQFMKAGEEINQPLWVVGEVVEGKQIEVV